MTVLTPRNPLEDCPVLRGVALRRDNQSARAVNSNAGALCHVRIHANPE